MVFLLILAPFAAFSLLLVVAPVVPSLVAGAAVAAAAIGYDVAAGRSIKMLAAGSLILFAALAGYFIFSGAAWSSTAIRLTVDAGILAIVLASLAAGMPFTLQYAREEVDAETAKLLTFVEAATDKRAAWEDVAWGLLNAKEFLLRR